MDKNNKSVRILAYDSMGADEKIVLPNGTVIDKEFVRRKTIEHNANVCALKTGRTFTCQVALQEHDTDPLPHFGTAHLPEEEIKSIIAEADAEYEKVRAAAPQEHDTFLVDDASKRILFDRVVVSYKNAVRAGVTTIPISQGCCPHWDSCMFVLYQMFLLTGIAAHGDKE